MNLETLPLNGHGLAFDTEAIPLTSETLLLFGEAMIPAPEVMNAETETLRFVD